MRRLGHGVFFAVMGVCFLVFIAIGVAEARDAAAGEPALWGTFVEQVCEPKPRGGCSSIGTWTSDDGSVIKTGVRLDGSVGDDGAVRAQFQAGGWMSDEENNIVHATEWASAGLWFPWVGAAGVAVTVAYYARRWRHRRTDR